MSVLRLLTFGVLTLSVSNALAAPRGGTKPQPASTSPDDALKVPPTTDPPRSKPPTTVAVPPTIEQDTAEPKRTLILEATLGAIAVTLVTAAIPIIENAYSKGSGAISKREAERDASYAFFAVGGILAVADIAIAIVDTKRLHEAQKARLVSTSESSAITLRF